MIRNQGKRSRKSQKGRGIEAVIHRELGDRIPIYDNSGSSGIVFSRKVVAGDPVKFITDSSGNSGAGATPANGVLTLGTSNFVNLWTVSDTILQNVDQVLVHEWFVKIIPVSNNAGSSQFYFDFDDSSASTVHKANAKNAIAVSNSNTSATAGIVALRATPPASAPWNQRFSLLTSPIPPVVYLKWYTEATLMGSVASTAEFVVYPYILASGYGREV